MKHLKPHILKTTFGLVIMALLWTGCKSDDPEPVNEEELITTLNVTFTNTADPLDGVTASFRDLDGEGGNDGTFNHPILRANTTYTVTLEFLNETETPAEDITAEVRDEEEEHQVFFIVGNGLELTYAYDDADSNGNPVGLTGTATIGAAGTGILDIVLVHEPDKNAAGVSSGDITNAGGEEDIRVRFNVTVQ